MIRTPSGKNLMNEQEAIQWLLDNNALPFQCTADYVGGAEIGLGTIVNPTPAKVRVGSLIFFADSKVSTVIALTSNSFICSDEYNSLVDDVVYVADVKINPTGYLIVTLSNGTEINAGLIKQVYSFSIDASQHLIVTYNDGTTNDLGAIFSGNISISGNLAVSGNITGGSIIENMSGYYFTPVGTANVTQNIVYAGVCKNGNKITFVVAGTLKKTASQGVFNLGYFSGIPSSVNDKIVPMSGDIVDIRKVLCLAGWNTFIECNTNMQKNPAGNLFPNIDPTNLTIDTTYPFRYEVTFLLSNNLAA